MKGRALLNFTIDVLLFINLAFIAGVGFLMNYTLLPGKERVLKYGQNTELYFLGLDRHQWGDIHLIAGFVMLGLIVLHIIFHWKIIVCFARKTFPTRSLRLGLTIVLISICAILLSFTFVISPTKSEEIDYSHSHTQRSAVSDTADPLGFEAGKTAEKNIQKDEHEYADKEIGISEIRGFMTLADVAKIYGIPVTEVKSRLGLPESLSDAEHLRELRIKYGLTMTRIRTMLDNKH